jgi:DNA-damage-inducible protein D
MVQLGSGASREVKDVRLTRYACYLIAQNSDPRKKIVAQAQTYFAVKTRQAELSEVSALQAQVVDLASQLQGDPLAEVAQRIALRQELTEANKELLRRAYEAGVITKRQLGMFFNLGYKGLYDERTLREMQTVRGLRPNQDLSDYMSALETFANYLRAILGKRNMQVRQVSMPHDAGIAHYDAGRQVRNLSLQSLGIAPEDLPRPTKSYRQIVKEEYERIQREEEDAYGLWSSLPSPDADQDG